jgi:hypothetical protein
MKVLTCAAARRRLHAFHDEELPVGDQIAVGAHLEWCDSCAAMCADLRRLRATLRATAPGRLALSQDESATLQGAVVSRVRAERTASFGVRVRGMFDDMHFVYAGLGAAVAMLICMLSLASLVRFVTPGSNENPVSVDSRVLMPVALNDAFSTLIDPADSSEFVFMIRAVVTREGTVANPELVHATSDEKPIAPGTQEAKAAETLMGAVSRARFEPARVDGLPVAVKMVWLVANTTVRGDDPTMVRPTPGAARKPVAWRIIAGLRAWSA